MRTVPWFVTVDNGTTQKKYCAWSQTEASAIRKSVIRFKKDMDDKYQMKVGTGITTECYRIFKKEADAWKGTTLR